jgi:predicted DCC family thiol-disulfide oxidoreductase YuxK
MLFDGCCPLCHVAVRFAVRRDRAQRVRVAPLESAAGVAVLSRIASDAPRPDTVVVVADPGGPSERVTIKSDAVIAVLEALPSPWRWFTVARWVPRPLRDWAYDRVARTRSTLWGRYPVCPPLRHEVRGRLLE